MCIVLLSTAHPQYSLVLLSNRDEFLNRPTARADWWDPPCEQVYGGRDLQRAEGGTWLSVTKQGRLAVLTNFREEGIQVNREKSRGGIVKDWLAADPSFDESEESFEDRLLNHYGLHDTGGFTLLFGRLRESTIAASAEGQSIQKAEVTATGSSNDVSGQSPGLAIISNHTSSNTGIKRIATTPNETHGLSNSWYGDFSWPKVVHGEMLLRQAVAANVSRKDDQQHFIDSLFDVLSVDTLPRRKHGEERELYTMNMRKSIFIPPAKGEIVDHRKGDELAVADGHGDNGAVLVKVDPGAYGTRTQTVILVDRQGLVTFVERTLYHESGVPIADNNRDKTEVFQIEGWTR